MMLLIAILIALFAQPTLTPTADCAQPLMVSVIDGAAPVPSLTVAVGGQTATTDAAGAATICLPTPDGVLVTVAGQTATGRVVQLDTFDADAGGIRFYPAYGVTMRLGVEDDGTLTVLPDDWARDGIDLPTPVPPVTVAQAQTGWMQVVALLIAITLGLVIYLLHGREDAR